MRNAVVASLVRCVAQLLYNKINQTTFIKKSDCRGACRQSFDKALFCAATRCEQRTFKSLLTSIVLIVSWPTTTMLAHVMLYAFFFPIASCVTSCNISYLFDRSEVHTLTTMFLLATFQVVSYAVINDLVTIFYFIWYLIVFLSAIIFLP